MIQYHPTTLAENGFLITEGARGEGAHLLNADGDRFMEKYAPNKMELASRDVVSRAEQTEINEGRGVGPDGGGIASTSPSSRASARSRRCARSSTSARTSRASTSPREPIQIRPGQHYIMGGVKTDIDGRDVDPRPLRRRRGRVRLGPRRQPPRRELAARHADLRRALRRARRPPRRRACRCRTRGRAQLREDERDDRRDHRPRPRGGRRISEIKDELGTVMNRHVAVFRDEAGLREAPRGRAAAQGGGADRVHRRPRHGLQPGRARRDRARVHARLRRGDRRRRASSARSRAGRSSAPTSPSATTRSGSSTSTSTATGTTRPRSATRP